MTNMISIKLEPAFISACLNLPPELQFMNRALKHQVEVFEKAKTNDVILDLAPTGTGKTKAGASVIKHNPQRNAIYIAPTNALIEQQTFALEKFVKDAGLPHVVKAASAKHIKQWPNERVGTRSGEKLYNVLREPATLFSECRDRPILLVTNPDIFYYATFFAYYHLDRSNIASEFYSNFATVIFDEFHLYDAKQLVSLFFYLTLSQVFGYFEHNRKIVLLTATPEPACDTALQTLEQSGVKITRIDGQESQANLIPSQTAVNLEIRPYPDKDTIISEITQEVIERLCNYPDRNGAVILDSKDTLGQISDALRAKRLENKVGRIIGNTPIVEREAAVQKQVILATSTVDVGFNFKKEPEPKRQNLDWLIFSSRDRASFWQRIGRVGRVLGKSETDVISDAIAYLPEKAWEENITDLDASGGRNSLKQKLNSLDCMQRPFLEVYWKSEAFLEIAQPLLELETVLDGLSQENLVSQLYQTLQAVLGGKRDWSFYRRRMKTIQGATNITSKTIQEIQKEWKYIKGGRKCVISFLKAYYPEECNNMDAEEIEKYVQENEEIAKNILEYATILKHSYAPLFRFRDSLFPSLKIFDPNYFLLDNIGETNLDPIHLLRFYEFGIEGDRVELYDRVEQPYQLEFSLQVVDLEEFKNKYLSKLYAFKNCCIVRKLEGNTRPTDFPQAISNAIKDTFIPGVIVKEHCKNRWAIAKLRKQGLEYYPIEVSDYGQNKPEVYLFFPSLSGILAIAQAGFALKCPDNEEFWIA